MKFKTVMEIHTALEATRTALAELYAPPVVSASLDTGNNRQTFRKLWKKIEKMNEKTEADREAIVRKLNELIEITQSRKNSQDPRVTKGQTLEDADHYEDLARRKIIELLTTANYEAELDAAGEIKEAHEKSYHMDSRCEYLCMMLESQPLQALQEDPDIIHQSKEIIALMRLRTDFVSTPLYKRLVENPNFITIAASNGIDHPQPQQDNPAHQATDVEQAFFQRILHADTELNVLEQQADSVADTMPLGQRDPYYKAEVQQRYKALNLPDMKAYIQASDSPYEITNERGETLIDKIAEIEERFDPFMRTAPSKSGMVEALSDAADEVTQRFHAMKNGGEAERLSFYKNKKAMRYAQKNNLSDADVAAIKIYSLGDHKYINASSQVEMLNPGERAGTWLDGVLKDEVRQFNRSDQDLNTLEDEHSAWRRLEADTPEQIATKNAGIQQALDKIKLRMEKLRQLRWEGNAHAQQVLRALRKIKPVKKTLYRGLSLSEAQFTKDFLKDYFVVDGIKSFSTERGTSEGFADKYSNSSQNRWILMILKSKKAKNIDPFSEIGGENECLLLPGARFEKVSEDECQVEVPGDNPYTVYKHVITYKEADE
jgi:hypothetical protein